MYFINTLLLYIQLFTIGPSPSNMAWRCTGKTNAELISNLAASGLIKNDRVLRAMSSASQPIFPFI
jgi:hypothetical protein